MKLSIVATLYKSETYILNFYQRASDVAKKLVGEDYEVVLVNDGSPDNSLEIAVELAEKDNHLVVVDLSRNFGHHKAMMTGLENASGERVFLIDSDLEEEPEWLLSFVKQMEDESCDVVYGIQEKRKGGFFEKYSGRFFYVAFRFFTGLPQPDNIVTARVMSKRYVEALLLHQEREINIGGLWIITGFKQGQQVIKKHSTSPTTYTFAGKLSHLVNAVTSFSSKPLVMTFYFGLMVSLSAILYISYLVFSYLFVATPPGGYTSIIASIWLFSGLIIFFIGVLGIYIAKVFSEVKQRPYTIVQRIYRDSHKDSSK